MANGRALATLKKGVAAWNKWREGIGEFYDEPDCDDVWDPRDAVFGYAEKTCGVEGNEDWLRDAVRKMKIKYPDLSGADLKSAKLVGANLAGVNFEHADLSGADLTGVDLRQPSGHWAGWNCWRNLRGANLTNSTLDGAELS